MTTTVATETAPVRTEHERLLGHAEHLRVAALELPALSNEERRELLDRILDASIHDVPRLQELLYGLHALITVHFQMEEGLYLPLLERELSSQ